MKQSLISFIVGLLISLCANTAFAAGAPEFDGAYIKTVKGSFEELKPKAASRTQISHDGMDVMELMRSPKTYYVIDKVGIKSITKAQFKGLVIRGEKDFKYLSVHPLVEKKLSKGEGFFENNGAASIGKPFFTVGEKIEIRQKSNGNNSYYFEPAASPKKGEYVAWLGNEFWLFEIK